jgi:hypothetical protein
MAAKNRCGASLEAFTVTRCGWFASRRWLAVPATAISGSRGSDRSRTHLRSCSGSKTDFTETTTSGAKRPFQTSAEFCAGVLGDRNDLEFLTGCTDYIPNSFAYQQPCHWGYEGNRTGLRVRFVLSHDAIFLYAPIIAPEGHRVPKGNSFS